MLPVLQDRALLRGVLFSSLPSAVVLLVVFPNMGKEVLGVGFGTFTPDLVVLVNFLWGIVGSFLYRQNLRKCPCFNTKLPFANKFGASSLFRRICEKGFCPGDRSRKLQQNNLYDDSGPLGYAANFGSSLFRVGSGMRG